jgi:hypothetical protein
MESQFDRESVIESNFQIILNEKFRNNQEFLKIYKNFKEERTISLDITWEQMKEKYDWGYRKGSLIDPLITWIYIRPDILRDLNSGKIKCSELTERFKLNEHYFLVEKKAIAFLKLHCGGFYEEGTLNDAASQSSDDSSKKSEQSELSYQTLKRRKLSAPIGIDDEAEED